MAATATNSISNEYLAIITRIKSDISHKSPHDGWVYTNPGHGDDYRGHVAQQCALMDSLIINDAAVYQANKTVAVIGGVQILDTITRAAIELPLYLRTFDSRPRQDKLAYLQSISTNITSLIDLLNRDNIAASVLDEPKTGPEGWPPHHFYHQGLLQQIYTEKFPVGRHLNITSTALPDNGMITAIGNMSRLGSLLKVFSRSIDCYKILLDSQGDINKGHAPTRLAIYRLYDSLDEYDELFKGNRNRISRDGLVAAFAAITLERFNYTNNFNNHIDSVYVNHMIKERRDRIDRAAALMQSDKAHPLSAQDNGVVSSES